MKKALLIFIITLISINTQAQEIAPSEIKHHEITISEGFFNDVQLFNLVGDILGAAITNTYSIRPESYNLFTPSITYRYWFNKYISLGGMVSFDMNTVLLKKNNEQWERHYRYSPTFACEFQAYYLNTTYVQLFGMVGLGFTINSVSKSDYPTVQFYNFQITPFGIRIGKSFGVFCEVGYGYKGFINTGLSYKF
ncbi:MAG: hypothetical protein LBR28_03400 [Bacteroidales bacterium]|jgi:hypothetical protein|nr:hypothetical protein [Bacteroidales bacterium]